MKRRKKKLAPVHPGEILREEFMAPLGLSDRNVAKGLRLSPITVARFTRGRRNLSPELALRLARYLGTTPEFWIGLQGQYDLDVAQDESEERINREVQRCPLIRAAA